MNKKIVSYIGFSVRKGAIKLGQEEVFKSGNKNKLIIYSSALAENTLKKLLKFADENKIQMLNLTKELDEVFRNKAVKVLGVTDISLANAIQKEYTQNI